MKRRVLQPETVAVKVILDSGAFTAWRQRAEISVHDYADFIEASPGLWSAIVNLDVIPGGFGIKPSPAEVERSASEGWKNLMILRDRGIIAVPVFHQGENLRWLDKMIDEGYDYVGVSPANDRTTKQKIEWLDEVFAHICGSGGYPQVRTHGFAVTAFSLIHRYPWHTVDSFTWGAVGAYGGVMIPRRSPDGKPDFNAPPHQVWISNRATERSDGDESYFSLGQRERDYILGFIQEQGFTLEQVMDRYECRSELNLRTFKLLSENRAVVPFRVAKKGFFASGTKYGRSEPIPGFNIVAAVNATNEKLLGALGRVGVTNVLFSYFYLKQLNAQAWEDAKEYIRTGVYPIREKKKRKKGVRKSKRVARPSLMSA